MRAETHLLLILNILYRRDRSIVLCVRVCVFGNVVKLSFQSSCRVAQNRDAGNVLQLKIDVLLHEIAYK